MLTFALAIGKRFANGVVVQLVRIPACHAGGRGFESRPYRKIKGKKLVKSFLPFFFLGFAQHLHINNRNVRILV